MNKFMRPVKDFWACLTDVGMAGVTDEKERKYIKFSNIIAVLTAVSVFFYIPFSLLSGSYLLGSLQAIDVICVLSVLWFNHRHYYAISRHAYIAIINTFVLINSCFIGFDAHVQDFFYISYIVPFLMFSIKDYKNILVGVLMSIAFFNIYQHIYPWFESYNLDSATQHLTYNINIWMKFILFGIAIYILSYYNFNSETELAISNLKLKQQADKLQQSNEDLEQFAAIISHDLKAPVRNVSSFMSLLKHRHSATLDADALNFIDLSKNSVDRMAKQIDDLLSYSKVGRNLHASGTVDVNLVLKTIEIELGEKIKEKNACIVIERPLPLLRQVHSSMIHHIFQNLIANGIKFNNDPAPEVRINCLAIGHNYVFHVRDNGIGIDLVYQDKLFNMFKRLHSDAEFEGTGIGLAVCKKIVNFYGGNIWLESQKGTGTSFFFTFPRQQGVIVKEPAKSYHVKTPGFAFAQAIPA
jgi:signal transduction histidine kinase